MTTFITLLPLYIFGNIHCFGMCGPLAFFISQNRYRYFYFAGRILSFTLAGAIAGALGVVIQSYLKILDIAAFVSILAGLLIFFGGLIYLLNLKLINLQSGGYLSQKFKSFSADLLLREKRSSTFLFGFITVFLPCAQTIVVFSACALSGSFLTGIMNGFIFALLTTPSLFLAMQSKNLFKNLSGYYRHIMGGTSLVIGALTMFRGLADLNIISHLVLNPNSASHLHIVIY